MVALMRRHLSLGPDLCQQFCPCKSLSNCPNRVHLLVDFLVCAIAVKKLSENMDSFKSSTNEVNILNMHSTVSSSLIIDLDSIWTQFIRPNFIRKIPGVWKQVWSMQQNVWIFQTTATLVFGFSERTWWHLAPFKPVHRVKIDEDFLRLGSSIFHGKMAMWQGDTATVYLTKPFLFFYLWLWLLLLRSIQFYHCHFAVTL